MYIEYGRLEKKFEKIVKRLYRVYPFLEGVSIDVCEGYGLEKATTHNPRQNSILLDLLALKKIFKTPRFEKRLGKVKTFDEFVLLILLHEIAHVEQFQTIPDHRINAAIRESDYDTAQGHDECWVEQEADTWARKAFRKTKKLL